MATLIFQSNRYPFVPIGEATVGEAIEIEDWTGVLMEEFADKVKSSNRRLKIAVWLTLRRAAQSPTSGIEMGPLAPFDFAADDFEFEYTPEEIEAQKKATKTLAAEAGPTKRRVAAAGPKAA
jgi:hypothetical protein